MMGNFDNNHSNQVPQFQKAVIEKSRSMREKICAFHSKPLNKF